MTTVRLRELPGERLLFEPPESPDSPYSPRYFRSAIPSVLMPNAPSRDPSNRDAVCLDANHRGTAENALRSAIATKPRVTQIDVARVAGVHNTTVSLALRNSPSIPDSTRRRIQAVAAELGYCPDPALCALATYRKHLLASRRNETIAYVTSTRTHPESRGVIEDQCLEGARQKAADCGYRLEHFWLGEPDMSGRRLSHILFHRGIRGLVLAQFDSLANESLDFDWNHLSGVTVGYSPRRLGLHRVTINQIGDIRLAVRRTLAGGYQRIGLVLPTEWDYLAEQGWSVGFTIEQNRMRTTQRIPILFHSAPRSRMCGIDVNAPSPIDPPTLRSWYDEFRPDVILGSSIAVLPALSQLGLHVSADVGFVDLSLRNDGDRLAGIRQNFHRVGEVAMDILIGQLQLNLRGLPAISTTTLVEGVWCEGASLPGPVVQVVA
jgi:LacI family transcriptional regulator